MTTVFSPLNVFYENWKVYADKLAKAIAPLTAEQLALRAAPNERSVGEMAQHIIGTRAGWFHYVLREGGEEIVRFDEWDRPGAPERSAAELVEGLNTSWEF